MSLDVEAVTARAAAPDVWLGHGSMYDDEYTSLLRASSEDVPALLAEIERLKGKATMTKHKIIFSVELGGDGDPEEALKAIREQMVNVATEGFGVTEYFEGRALGSGGYEGPFVMNIQAVDPDS